MTDSYDESYIDSSVERSVNTAIAQWDINAIGADVESCGLKGLQPK